MKQNRREIGKEKEEQAAIYLEKQGCIILEKNFYTRTGEIDLIVKDKEYLVFVEVKYRSNETSGFPGEAITQKKRNSIIQTAKNYLRKYSYHEDTPCRFDAVLILDKKIEWILNAFELN